MKCGYTLLELICIKKSVDIWTGCCYVQNPSGNFRTLPPSNIFFMMQKNSQPWHKSTTNLLNFAGWFLKKIEGNLLLHGSVPVQQNHSSVAAHLGAGASWSVAEQVEKLLLRQLHLTAKQRHKDSQAFVATVNYKSRLQDQDAFHEEAANQQLSQYGYHKLFLVEYKTSRHLQFVVHENDTIVWPCGSPQNCDEHVLICGGQRCSCEGRLAFNHQCHHELCRDGKFDLSKYSTRWLNRKTFNSTIFSFNQQIPQAEPQTAIGEDGGLSEDDGPGFPQGVVTDNLRKVDPEERRKEPASWLFKTSREHGGPI
jgi:hypothetical protein